MRHEDYIRLSLDERIAIVLEVEIDKMIAQLGRRARDKFQPKRRYA